MSAKKDDKKDELTEAEKMVLTLMIIADPTFLITELLELIKPKS